LDQRELHRLHAPGAAPGAAPVDLPHLGDLPRRERAGPAAHLPALPGGRRGTRCAGAPRHVAAVVPAGPGEGRAAPGLADARVRRVGGEGVSSAQWGLLGALCGVLFAAGGWLVLAGWRGTDPARPQRASALARRWRRARADLPEGWARNYRWVAVAAGTAMLAGWWVTARPVHGLLA